MKKEQNKYIFIGAKIKEARQELNMPQKELANLIGFDSPTAISLIESGDRKVSVEDLGKIADILHKNIKFFLGEDVEINFEHALRADKNLSAGAKKEVLNFYNFIKEKHGRRDSKK